MRSTRHAVWYASLIGIALIAGALACSSEQLTAPRVQLGQLDRPLSTVQYGDWECPWYIPPSECEELTSAERETLYWDVQRGIQWWAQDCADVGHALLDFAQYGNARKWHLDNDGTMGIWQMFTNGNERISLNDLLFTQGWASERLFTFVHEGYHYLYNDPDDDSADSFASGCINW